MAFFGSSCYYLAILGIILLCRGTNSRVPYPDNSIKKEEIPGENDPIFQDAELLELLQDENNFVELEMVLGARLQLPSSSSDDDYDSDDSNDHIRIIQGFGYTDDDSIKTSVSPMTLLSRKCQES